MKNIKLSADDKQIDNVKAIVNKFCVKDNAFMIATLLNVFTLLFGEIWLKASGPGAYELINDNNIFFISFIITEALLAISVFYICDLYVLLSSCVLLDTGVFIQTIFIAEEGGDSASFIRFWISLIIAMVAALLAASVYALLSKKINFKNDKKILYIGLAAIFASTLIVTVLLLVSGKTDGANISLRIGSVSIGIAEFYKPFWVTFAALIVCTDVIKSQKKKFLIFTLYTFFVLASLLVCNELGTLAIILLSYFVMTYIVWDDNKYVSITFKALAIAGLAGLLLFVLFFHDFSMLFENGEIKYIDGTKGGFAGLIAPYVNKIITRTANWLYPLNTVGSQAAISYKANVAGGLLGNNQTFNIPVQECDYTFSGVVLRLGFLFGILLGALYLMIFIRTVLICENKREKEGNFDFLNISAYASAIVIVLSSFISIAGNTSLLPLTGIVSPLIARGSTANMISMYFLTLIIFNSVKKKPKKIRKNVKLKKLQREENHYYEETI